MTISKPLKILLIGGFATGKTTYITRWNTGEFTDSYAPSDHGTVHNCTYRYKDVKVKFEVHEAQVIPEDIDTFDGIIWFFSVIHHASMQYVEMTREILQTLTNKKIPQVICGTHVDEKYRDVKAREISLHRKEPKAQYFELSSKSNYNFEKPFFFLTREILGF